MSCRRTLRTLVTLIGLVTVGIPAVAAAQQACEVAGRWAFKVEWAGGDCTDLPDDNGVLVILRGDDGQFSLGDVEDGAGALDRHVTVRAEQGGGCRIKLDFDINQTAYGAPDVAHWTYSLLDRGGAIVGSGSYAHDERAKKGGKRCTQRFAAAGAHSARSARDGTAPTPDGLPAAPPTPTTPAAPPSGTTPTTPAGAAACSDGQSVTVDTASHCCWAGQAWSSLRNRCVGIPTGCPEGRHVEAESCNAGSEAERVSALLTREVGARRGALDECYRRAFPEGNGPKGYLRLRLTVKRSGQVEGAQVIEDGLHADAVSACAVQMVNGWQLPSPAVDEALFEYAFMFAPPAAPAAPKK